MSFLYFFVGKYKIVKESKHLAECTTRKAKESGMVGIGDDKYGRWSAARSGHDCAGRKRRCDGLAVLVEVDLCRSPSRRQHSCWYSCAESAVADMAGSQFLLTWRAEMWRLALHARATETRTSCQNRRPKSETRPLQAKSPRYTSFDIEQMVVLAFQW